MAEVSSDYPVGLNNKIIAGSDTHYEYEYNTPGRKELISEITRGAYDSI